jgi:hypothetical protein
MTPTFDAHQKLLGRMLVERRVVTLLGAGANRCGRPQDSTWTDGYLPDGRELARHLADCSGYPGEDDGDLLRVSQYIAVKMGAGALYEWLHEVFAQPAEPNPLHRYLAALPAERRRRGLPPGHVTVTTNYDDALERAFADADEPFDVVTYIADGDDAGRFLHRRGPDECTVIELPNEYGGLTLEERTVILKLHGAIDRVDPVQDSYVITEDDYIAYLTRADVSSLLPVTLSAELSKCHFLFLGYSLRDWNLRVILHRIWGRQRRRYKSWAVQHARGFPGRTARTAGWSRSRRRTPRTSSAAAPNARSSRRTSSPRG